LRGKYVRSVNVSGGVLVASMDLGTDSNGQAINRTLTFRPWLNRIAVGSPIVWSCGLQEPGFSDDYNAEGAVAADPVENAWLPAVCRALD
jgi:hypothetical protein